MGFFTDVSSKAKKLTGDITKWQRKQDKAREAKIYSDFAKEQQAAKLRKVQRKTEKLRDSYQPKQTSQPMFDSNQILGLRGSGFFRDDRRIRDNCKKLKR